MGFESKSVPTSALFFPLFLSVAVVWSFGSAGSVAADCGCDAYLSQAPYRSLAEDVARVGIAALDPNGRAFSAQPYRLQASAYYSVPEQCRALLAGGAGLPRLKLAFRGTVSSWDRDPERADIDPSAISATYKSLLSAQGAPDGAAAQAALSTQLAASTDADLAISVLKGAPVIGGRLVEPVAFGRAMPVVRALHAVLQTTTDAEALSVLSGYKDLLTTRQKLLLVQTAGMKFHANYDRPRNSQGNSAEGAVTLSAILGAARRNQSRLIDDPRGARDLDFDGTDQEFAGVCRDIASAQGQMLIALGLKNTYVVSHVKTATYHVTVVSQDDKDPTRIYKFDYSRLNGARGGDSRALYQGDADQSLNYRVFRPGDKMKADVLSEYGKFMAEAAGADIHDIDPFARAYGHMAAAEASFGSRKQAQLRAGAGSDGISKYVFAGGNYSWFPASWAPGQVGLVLARKSRDLSDPSPTADTQDIDLVYLHLEQRFRTPSLRFAPGIEARIEGLLQAMASVHRDAATRQQNGQGDGRAQAALKVSQEAWERRWQAVYRASVQVVPGRNDVRSNSSTPQALLNQLLFTAEGRLRLSKSPEGRAYLVAATTVLIDQLGQRGRVEAGIVSDRGAATVLVEGRLSDDTITIQDGTGRRGRVNLTWSPSRVLRLSVVGDASFEGRRLAPLGASSNLELRF